jgi:hypothetical protein
MFIDFASISSVTVLSDLIVPQTYGFPKIYRHMLRWNKKLFSDPQRREKNVELARLMFRWPRLVQQWWRQRKADRAAAGNPTLPPSSASSDPASNATLASNKAANSTSTSSTKSSNGTRQLHNLHTPLLVAFQARARLKEHVMIGWERPNSARFSSASSAIRAATQSASNRFQDLQSTKHLML